jgi:catechol 2,3-dioxygenase-like lactoylglutathione lyase family enzyme
VSHARALAHIGVTVPDLDRAVAWYQDVLGLELLLGPVEVETNDSHTGDQVRDVFGRDRIRFRQAHLSMGNGVALEMFEFAEPPGMTRPDNFEFWKTGVFHICIVDRDIDTLVERIEATGGRLRTRKVWSVFSDQPKYRFCYCEDPFGNIIELYSHSHEQVFANRRGY